MTRSRIEALLAAFPKLIGTGKQHTFIETESVRYVYQPIEKLYVLLITTKASNILEDLETLRLFARVIPEYSKGVEETDILKNAFQIIFAFDEIVALGYRENVNLAQVRTFIEMDSHEERVARAMRETQEREAKDIMKRKAKELHQQRRDATKRGVKTSYGFPSLGNVGVYSTGGVVPVTEPHLESINNAETGRYDNNTSPAKRHVPTTGRKALRIGHKNQEADIFVNQLKAEGEDVALLSASANALSLKSEPITIIQDVQCRIEERLNVKVRRDGSLLNMELLGSLQVCVKNDKFLQSRIRLYRDEFFKNTSQTQTHPNIDKQEFQNDWIQSKPDRSYPLSQEVGVLRWRFQTRDEARIPLIINCWPNETGGNCEVNIEYELHGFTGAELSDVVITIPLPHGCGAPVVSSCDGMYNVDGRSTKMTWSIPLIDKDNKTGVLDFLTKCGNSEDFFPIHVSFDCDHSLLGIRVDAVQNADGTPATYTSTYKLATDPYEVV